jgi:hypothetical protein
VCYVLLRFKCAGFVVCAYVLVCFECAVLWCALMYCFILNAGFVVCVYLLLSFKCAGFQTYQPTNQFTHNIHNNHSSHYEIPQSVTFVFCRLLGMSSFMYELVSVDIAVMCAVRRSV